MRTATKTNQTHQNPKKVHDHDLIRNHCTRVHNQWITLSQHSPAALLLEVHSGAVAVLDAVQHVVAGIPAAAAVRVRPGPRQSVPLPDVAGVARATVPPHLECRRQAQRPHTGRPTGRC